MKSIVHPTTGQIIRFGRKRPSRAMRMGHFHISRYLDPLPPAPDFDYSVFSTSALRDILGNDKLGDCTSAGAWHAAALLSGGGGVTITPSLAQAIAFYSLSTGYNQADPSTDQGGDEVTVLTTWRDKGLDGNGLHKIAGFVQLDPENYQQVKSAAYLFGSLYFGVELPDTWTNPFPTEGFIWQPGPPDPEQGHCVVSIGGKGLNDPNDGLMIDTWGMFGTITFAAIAQLCSAQAGGMLFAVVTQEWVNRMTGFAPNGADWQQIQKDFGLVPTPDNPPSPNPVPPVPPVPAGGWTLANAQAWASAGLAEFGADLLALSDAQAAASAGLAKYGPTS